MKTLVIGSGVVVSSKCGKAPSNFRGIYRSSGGIAGPCILRTRTGTVAGVTHSGGDDSNTAVCIATSPYVRYTGLVVRTNVGQIICSRRCHLRSKVRLLGHTNVRIIFISADRG